MTRCSGCRVQDWVLVWASACHLATPKDYSRRQLKSLTANQWLRSELLGQSSGELGLDRRTTWTSTNTRYFLVCNSCCWPQQACLRKRCYHCWLSSRVKNGFYALQILNHDNPLYVKWNFQWNWQEVVTNQSSFITNFNLLIMHWFLSSKNDKGTNQHVPNRILCKAADLNWLPVQEKGICSDSKGTAQQLQIAVHKSLEMMSGIVLNWSQANSATKWVLFCSKWNVMFEGNKETSIDRTSFNFWYEDFFSNMPWKTIIYCKQWQKVYDLSHTFCTQKNYGHARKALYFLAILMSLDQGCQFFYSLNVLQILMLQDTARAKILLCYWPTIQSSILNICPNFQVLSSQFSEVYELLNKHWANLSENISIPISVQCYNMYW